jgi:hypothetical protein
MKRNRISARQSLLEVRQTSHPRGCLLSFHLGQYFPGFLLDPLHFIEQAVAKPLLALLLYLRDRQGRVFITVVPREDGKGLPSFVQGTFAFLLRNSSEAIEYFRLSRDMVVEIGRQFAI